MGVSPMHDGNMLLLVAALPLVFGVAAWFAWGRGLRHGLVYATFVTIAYAFCGEVVAGAVLAAYPSPADAYASVHQALMARLAGAVCAAAVGTWLAWKLRQVMVSAA